MRERNVSGVHHCRLALNLALSRGQGTGAPWWKQTPTEFTRTVAQTEEGKFPKLQPQLQLLILWYFSSMSFFLFYFLTILNMVKDIHDRQFCIRLI